MSGSTRAQSLDALRGAAMLWMTAFHFCFDLAWLGFWPQNFYADPFWTWQRNAIVSLFLLCAGAAQVLSVAAGQSWQQFWRRWLQIAGCAALVSLGSWLLFPKSFIYFGILQALCVMLPVLRWCLLKNLNLWVLSVIALASFFVASNSMDTWAPWQKPTEMLNSKAFSVLGLVSNKPITEDFVPLLPWLVVVMLGAAIAQAWRPVGAAASPSSGPTTKLLRSLALLGRFSLSYYMLHQPVLIGLLMLMKAVL